MRVRDVPPSIKRLFPWSLFLLLAALFAWLALVERGHSEEDQWACYGGARYEAMSSSWAPCNHLDTMCDKVKAYLATHSKEEGRALAVEKHVPQWLIKRAEKCIP